MSDIKINYTELENKQASATANVATINQVKTILQNLRGYIIAAVTS